LIRSQRSLSLQYEYAFATSKRRYYSFDMYMYVIQV